MFVKTERSGNLFNIRSSVEVDENLVDEPNECNRCKDKTHKRKNYLWLEELLWLPALWPRKSIPQRFEHYIDSEQRLNLELRHQGACLRTQSDASPGLPTHIGNFVLKPFIRTVGRVRVRSLSNI
jgi:hypothetical protein